MRMKTKKMRLVLAVPRAKTLKGCLSSVDRQMLWIAIVAAVMTRTKA
jgi:hypothetical protein